MLLTYSPKGFYGRENEIVSILQVITAAEPGGHAIYGIRTIGKTFLLKFLKDKNGALKRYEGFVGVEYRAGGDKRLFFVYVNFHIFTEGESIFYIMLEQLDEDLQNDELGDQVQIPPFDDETSRQDLVNILRRTLQKLGQQDVRAVFLLDDFDLPLTMLDHYDDGLLRTLNDYAALIIATEAPISELRPDFDDSSPFLGILRPESIGLLNDHAARELICHPIESIDLRYTDDEEDFLVTVAGRQPFLLKAACEQYFDLRTEYPDVAHLLSEPLKRAEFHIQFMAQFAVQLHVVRVLQSTWARLKPEERRTLYMLASSKSKPPTAIVSGSASELSKDAASLLNKGLLYRDVKHNVHRLFSAIFAEFVLRTYDVTESKPAVKPPLAPISPPHDNLTPIDGALLKYFVRHSDRVCTFEELLDAVWQDGEKSKRALEAAVHRLRKTLGQDESIKNIRGIGYKFVSANSAVRKSKLETT
jgi:hypothetical protein